MPLIAVHLSIALDVSSVPLSETISNGLSCSEGSRSSTRTMRALGSEASTSVARPVLVNLDIEYAEATAAFEHVGDEVEHPDLARPACRLKRRTRAKCPLAAPPPTNHQALLSIQPIDLLQVHHVALSASHFA